MAPLIVLIITTLATRASGIAGVSLFNIWEAATRAGLTALFLLTASAHFYSMKK